MKKTMKKVSLTASVTLMLLCLVLVTGSTFSLFTSKAGNDIAVNSATVSVKAEIGELALSSLGVAQDGDTFANGGGAVYENGILTISNVTPGDKVTFPIAITNSSTVDIQYKITWTVTDAEDGDDIKLSEMLVATADGEEIKNGATAWTPWTTEEDKEKIVNVSVELPLEVGDDYQKQSANINFLVEAIQGNGNPSEIKTPDQLLIAAQNGGEVALQNDITLDEGDEIVIPEGKSLTIDLAGNSLTTADGQSITNNGALYIVDNGKAESQVVAAAFMLASDETAGTVISATGAPAIINNGEMTLIDVNVTADVHKDAGHVILNEGIMTISGGSVTSAAANGGSAIKNNGTLTVDGTTITGAPQEGESWPSYAINHYGDMMTLTNVTVNSTHGAIAAYGDTVLNDCRVELNGFGGSSHVFYIGGEGTEVVINSGVYNHNGNGDGSLGYIMGGTTLTINGGAFTATNGGYGFATYPGELVVNGGTFNNAFLDWGGPITVYGGTFKNDPKAYIPVGYESTVNEDGTYTVAPGANTTVVKTAEDLLALSGKSMSSNNGAEEEKLIVFLADVDLNGADFSSIVAQYNDKLNVIGNGHVISNANVVSAENDNSTEQAGMFYGYSGSTITISDLGFKNITVTTTATSDSANYAALIVGYAEAKIVLNNVDAINCHVYGAKSSGIFAGHLSGSLTATDCDVAESSVTVLEGVEVDGHYAGKYIGTLAGASAFTDCTVDVTLAGNLHKNNIGDIYGRSTAAGSVANYEIYEVDNVTYLHETVSDDVILSEVSADYAESALTIPEGVTTIGNYAFLNNKTVKTVELASTVRDLGRGFDSSTVEKVVLNEGLTTIGNRAFKATTALKEVVISSTVTTIADNAFQKSAIKEIVIPANVKTVGETAFGASLVETVTIEGDVNIEGYAFRGCTKLRTVYLNGMDVNCVKSSLNGRNSMWFCNGESNNPGTSNITFYVKTDVIKDRILTAMGAEKDNTVVNVEMTAAEGGYYTDSEGNALVYDKAGLEGAIAAGEDKVVLVAGEYVMPDGSDLSLHGKTLTVVGDKNTVIDVSGVDERDQFVTGATLVFEGVTLNFGTVNYMGFANATELVYRNCIINGLQFLYGPSVTFENCVLNSNGAEHCVWTWGVQNVSFTDCDFTYGDRAINCYGENVTTNASFTNCTFTKVEGKETSGAIETNSSTLIALNLIIDNCTVNEGDLWWISEWDSKDGANTHVTVDGIQIIAPGLGIDASGNYYVYNANGLMAFRSSIGTWGSDTLAGKSINIMDDIDAAGKTWETAVIASGSASRNGFTFNGNGSTISNLTIVKNADNATPGTGLFAMNAGNNTPTTFKDLTFDNVTVDGGMHTGILWGQMYGKIVVDNVKVTNSDVTGMSNVGALVGRNGDDNASEITFKNCSVTNTKVTSLAGGDNAGASSFLGMALEVAINRVSVVLTFEGENVSEGNTLTTAEGQQGGGVYAIASYGEASWDTPIVVEDFTNYSCE